MSAPAPNDPILVLPQTTGGRDAADRQVAALGDFDGRPVFVDARHMDAGTQSFAHQLVMRLLGDPTERYPAGPRASALILVAGTVDFRTYVSQAADDLGVAGKLTLHDGPLERRLPHAADVRASER